MSKEYRSRVTGDMADIIIHGGLALFSLGLTALFAYGAVEAPTVPEQWAAGSVGALFGIGTAHETERMVSNIVLRRRLRR